MASPTMKESRSQFRQTLPIRLRLPLWLRRIGAWSIEVTLISASALIPYSLGAQVNAQFQGETVPLNPVLMATEDVISEVLALPPRPAIRMVAPLTNLLWSVALATPLILSGISIYGLATTGRTLPKRWFGVRVVTPTGAPPGLIRVFLREGLGRWGLPLAAAYSLWRLTGAFPDLLVLAGLTGVLFVGESASAVVSSRRRTGHDRLSGTFVIDAFYPRWHPWQSATEVSLNGSSSLVWSQPPEWTDEDDAIAAIVLTPGEPHQPQASLWIWMRQHPGLTLLILSLSSIGLVLGTFVGTQVYIQNQANRREFKQQDNAMFLALVSKLSPQSTHAIDDRQSAILALGTLKDPRVLPLLVDLLSQTDVPVLIDAIQQALIGKGPEALPYLRRLNQALANDIESLSRGPNVPEQTLAALRQRATQRAIAKILTIYSGQIHSSDLSRIDLGQTLSGPAQFTLVLDQIDLSGLQWRSANLSGASLRGSRFYGPGVDRHWGTFDDWIADLSGADLKAANLTGALLSNVSLGRASLIQAILNKADLSKAQLTGANLSSARLIETNLKQALLDQASLTGADLANANLTQASLREARLSKASAQGAQLRSANLTGSDWQGADLSGADFSQANLQNANLSSTRLVGTTFAGAQLQNTSLRQADLSSIDLRGANLNGTDFLGATFVTTIPTSPDQFIKIPPPPKQTLLLQGVDFTTAKNLSTEQISYLCSQGAIHPKCQEGDARAF